MGRDALGRVRAGSRGDAAGAQEQGEHVPSVSERRFFGVVTDDKKRECTNDDEAVEDEALFVKKNFFFAKTKSRLRDSSTRSIVAS